MRRVIPLGALLLMGCLPSTVEAHRRPGSDIVLPASTIPLVQRAGGVTCITFPAPGVATTIATGTSSTPNASPAGGVATATIQSASTCVGAARRDSSGDYQGARPPLQ